MRGDTISIQTDRTRINGRPLALIAEEMMEFHDRIRVRIGEDFDRVFVHEDLDDFDHRLLDMLDDMLFPPDGELRAVVVIEPHPEEG